MNLNLNDIAKHFAWTYTGDPDVRVGSISIDTRTIGPGELFVALLGEDFDGHAFVAQAAEKGAAAAMVEEQWYRLNREFQTSLPLLIVPDTLIAFQELARFYRKTMEPKVVALTGSAGKTTCKDMIYSVLSRKYRTRKNIKSFNNHVGVPLTLLSTQPDDEILVTELGTSGFGEIERSSYLVEPDVCLLLNIGYAHLQAFKDLVGVARAKMEIVTHAKPDRYVIYNADDEILSQQNFGGRVMTYAVDQNADVKARNLECNEHAQYQFMVDDTRIELSLPGRHNVLNALAAIAVGRIFDVPMVDIKSALKSVDYVSHRMTVIYQGSMRIIDDSYNANPSSCRAAFSTLADMELDFGGRRIAVLGDMLELGEASEFEHTRLADALAENGIRILLTYGTHMAETAERARSLSFDYVSHSRSQETLIDELLSVVKDQDIVLIKGSRGMHMENIIDALNTNREAKCSTIY